MCPYVPWCPLTPNLEPWLRKWLRQTIEESQMKDCVQSRLKARSMLRDPTSREREFQISLVISRKDIKAVLVLGILNNEWTMNMSCWVTVIFSVLEWSPDIKIGQSALFLWTILQNVLEINQIKIITSTIKSYKWTKCTHNEISKVWIWQLNYSQIVLNFCEILILIKIVWFITSNTIYQLYLKCICVWDYITSN